MFLGVQDDCLNAGPTTVRRLTGKISVRKTKTVLVRRFAAPTAIRDVSDHFLGNHCVLFDL